MLKNLKSLFVVEDASGAGKKTQQPVAEETATPVKQTNLPPVGNLDGEVQDRFLQVLFKAMEDANLEGFDYMEFRQSLQSLENVPMDEATRYKSAFAMAQTLGATPQNLLDSGTHYLKILKAEEDKFEGALQNQKSLQIGTKVEERQRIAAEIAEKESQIRRLQEEIQALEKRDMELEGEVEEAGKKVFKTKEDFHASYAFVVAQIQKDLDNMQRYLR